MDNLYVLFAVCYEIVPALLKSAYQYTVLFMYIACIYFTLLLVFLLLHFNWVFVTTAIYILKLFSILHIRSFW